jgi:hypothetical protein
MQELKTNIQEVKKYLIVGLSNIMFSNKKETESVDDNDDEYSFQKDNIKSRLDLLFARYNLVIKKFDEACDKLTNSIISYGELYGPESIGLTINYYNLAIYFDEAFPEKDRTDVIRGIIIRIAEIWKKHFLGESFEGFNGKIVYNIEQSDKELLLLEGEYYVRKILSMIRKRLNDDKDLVLKFKIIRFLILKEMNSTVYKEVLSQVIKLRDSCNVVDKAFLDDLNDKLII